MTLPLADIRTIRSARAIARRDFFAFCDFVHLSLLPERVAAPFHEYLTARIAGFMDSPGNGILIINQPPGTAKTLFIRLLIAYVLARSPRRAGYIANTDVLATRSGRFIRDLVDTPRFRLLFPDIWLSQSAASTTDFELSNGSSFGAAGINTGLLGARFDLICIDDPISTFEQASSETQLQKMREAYDAVIKSRIQDNNSKIILISQRLARNDLTGHILDNAAPEGFPVQHIKLEMECTDPAADPLGRAVGQLLWPERFGPMVAAEFKRDEFLWMTMYQQLPPSDVGSWADMQKVLPTPVPVIPPDSDDFRIYIGIDIAHTVGAGDYTVIVVIAFEKRTGAMHVLDIWRRRVDHSVTAETLLDLIETWRPALVLIEKEGGSTGFVSHLNTRAMYRRVGLPLEWMPHGGQNKESKAGALRAKINSRMLHVDRSQPWSRDLVNELTHFPNGRHDDQVDALALIAKKTSAMVISHASAPVEQKLLPTTAEMDLNTLFEINEQKSVFKPRF